MVSRIKLIFKTIRNMSEICRNYLIWISKRSPTDYGRSFNFFYLLETSWRTVGNLYGLHTDFHTGMHYPTGVVPFNTLQTSLRHHLGFYSIHAVCRRPNKFISFCFATVTSNCASLTSDLCQY